MEGLAHLYDISIVIRIFIKLSHLARGMQHEYKYKSHVGHLTYFLVYTNIQRVDTWGVIWCMIVFFEPL